MKKTFISVICIILILTFTLPFASAFEKEGVNIAPRFGFNPIVTDMGDGTFRYELYAYGLEKMTSAGIHIYYDAETTELIKCKDTSGADMFVCNEESDPIKISLVYTLKSEEKLTCLFELTFRGDPKTEIKTEIDHLGGSSNKAVYEPVYLVKLPDLVIMKGDVDGDGRITAADARLALRIAVLLDKPTAVQFKAADADDDNKITPYDARMILRVAVKLINFE